MAVLYGLFVCCIMLTGCNIERGRGNPRQCPGTGYGASELRYNKTRFVSENLVPVEREAFHNLSFFHRLLPEIAQQPQQVSSHCTY